ncbi:hypothetical protein B0T14DRAFT_518642 [Immersiella caudata]|uniref:Uncharacterized protein n=1 Tax=Immersiella caudata TaxID=314043 RepID=A0AA40BYY7_9PEZI|nr:hypothetical protein B0T14DRAFT_518642 [Immersiella caudata]
MANLRLALFSLLVAATSVFAAAAPDVLDIHTDLLARQAPGTPQFDCHSACGSTISGSRVQGYCTNETWTTNYENCLECALEFDIWKHYGGTIVTAAGTCGLTAVPSPAAGASSTSGPAASGSTTPTPTAPATSRPAQTTAAVTTSPSTAGAALATAAPALIAGILMAAAAL